MKATGQLTSRNGKDKMYQLQVIQTCLVGPTSGRSSEMLVNAVFLCLL